MGSLPDSKYIIQTDGYWFVEAHDVDPSKGYISVSAKGIVNGLSNQPNDGCDFGPDSYNPSYSGSGVPYTQTSGIQEAVDYAENNKSDQNGTPKISFSTGTFSVSGDISVPSLVEILFSGSGRKSTVIEMIAGSKGFVIPNNVASLQFEDIYFISDSSSSIFTNDLTAYNGSIFRMHRCIVYLNSSTSNIGEWGLYYFTDVTFFSAGTSIMSFNMSTSGQISAVVDFINCNLNESIVLAIGNTQTVNFIGGMINGAVNVLTGINIITFSSCQLGASGTLLTSVIYSSNTSGVTVNAIYLLNYGYTLGSTQDLVGSNVTAPVVFKNYGYEYPGNALSIPATTPTLSANPPVSATVYQNTNPYDIEIDLPVYATTSGTAGYVTIAKGASSSSLTTIGNQFVNGSTSSTSVDIIRLRVPAGWYYEFTASGVTFGTASVFAD